MNRINQSTTTTTINPSIEAMGLNKVAPAVAHNYYYPPSKILALCGTGYIDDMGVWTNGSFQQHLAVVDTVLKRLANNGFKPNSLKFEWGVQETDFLGCSMTQDAVRGAKRSKPCYLLHQTGNHNATQILSWCSNVLSTHVASTIT
jgi:hypothetical protein